jgi:APA family basic amino acid/polyamine antiporter
MNAHGDEVKGIGARAATMLVVASMIGTGVFTTTGFLVEALRSPAAVLAAWIVGGLLALSGALSYAELSAALPRNGGEYHLLGRVYHPAVGFAAGIVSLVVGFAAPLAASALAFGHYLSAALPGIPPLPAAVVIVVVFTLMHGVDVTWGSRFQGVVTATQVVLIAAMAVTGFVLGEPSRLLAPGPQPALGTMLSPEFAVALVFVSYAYSGWNSAAYIAGEVRTPSRTLPLALLFGTVLVTALYVGLNVVYLASAPASDLSGVVEVANVAAQRLVGAPGGRVLSGLIAMVLASSVGAMLMAGSRVYEAMGCDYRAFSFLARRTRRGAPAAAVALQAALALAMVATSSFGTLLGFIGFTLSVSAGLTVLGVLVLRVREPQLARPYRTWGYPFTPLLFVGLSMWMIGHSLVERPVSSIAGVGIIAFALALYALVARSGSPAPSATTILVEPEGDP